MLAETNNAEERTSAIVGKCRRLVKTLRGTDWTYCVVGILPVMEIRGQEYRNCRRMVIKYRRYVWKRE